MDRAVPLLLDDSLRPILAKDEITLRLQEQIDLYDNDVKTHSRHGVCIVTTHRLCWIGGAEAAIHWHLSHVHSIGKEEAGFFVGSAKIVVYFRQVGQDGPSASRAKLSFKAGGRDEFIEQLNTALRRKEWAAPIPGVSAAGARGSSDGSSAPAVRYLPGLAGIQDRIRDEHAKAAAEVSDAMSDLRSLSEHAKRLVLLAEDYAAKAASRATVKAGAASAASPGGGSVSPDDDGGSGYSSGVSLLVRDLGIVNPVTRAAAGTLYLQEVARQLASFLRAPLDRVGGMLSLADVYSLYNRARVTDLISPDDLVDAARLLEPLRLGMHMHTFPSQLVVIRLDSFSPQGVAQRLLVLLEERCALSQPGRSGICGADTFLTSLDVAAAWKTPLHISLQLLLTAESQGALCRDDSIAGLRFFSNRFT